MENYRLVLLINDLLIKHCVNSKFNGDRRNFLANKTLGLVLELHGQNLTIQHDSHLKQSLKNVFHSKTCQYIELEPLKIQSAKTAFLKRDEYLKNGKCLLNLPDGKVFFFKIETFLSKIFLKKTISILLTHLWLKVLNLVTWRSDGTKLQ